jgi:NAD(P)-dependent dehydrogenase (short-subunit alcohol dehydrogenase family)
MYAPARSGPAMSDTRSLKYAAVSGAGQGIGAAIVSALSRDGWRIAAIDRDGQLAGRVVQAAGAGHIAVKADVGDEQQVVAAFRDISAHFPRLDALAACVGVVDSTALLDLTPEIFIDLYRVNVVGTFLCIREAAKLMPAGGRICTMSSVAALRGGGVFGTAAYAASKAAVLGLTKTAARELAKRSIAVNCIVPGPTDTPMLRGFWHDPAQRERVQSAIPLRRPGQPDEIAATAAWLLSPAASYVNGATIVADGGMTMY